MYALGIFIQFYVKNVKNFVISDFVILILQGKKRNMKQSLSNEITFT